MCDGSIRGDDQVQVLHHGGGIHKRAVLAVELVTEIAQCQPLGDRGNLFGAVAPLQTDEFDALLGQGCEGFKRDRTEAVSRIIATALPGNADLVARDVAERIPPMFYQRRPGRKVGGAAGNVRKRRT